MKLEELKIGVLGATGLVGEQIVKLLVEHNVPKSNIKLAGSPRSAGDNYAYVEGMKRLSDPGTNARTCKSFLQGLDVLFTCVADEHTRVIAEEAQLRGVLVIDGSNVFRMDKDVPLVLHRVNDGAIKLHQGIIASPNCVTSILLVALHKLSLSFHLRSLVCSSYQSVSGEGRAPLEQFQKECRGEVPREECRYLGNIIPCIGAEDQETGVTSEELKLATESSKILDNVDLRASMTGVRVPVERVHTMNIIANFARTPDLEEIEYVLGGAPGVIRFQGSGSEYSDFISCAEAHPTDVVVGRVVGTVKGSALSSQEVSFTVAGDQLMVGAAWNMFKILEQAIAFGCAKGHRAIPEAELAGSLASQEAQN